MSALERLVSGEVGAARAAWLVGGLDLDPSLLAVGAGDKWVPRAVLAQAVGVVLLDGLLQRVRSAAAYIEDKLGRGETVHLDHGAVRTVAGVACGALPSGQDSITRVLAALGYRHRETYDLARLRMTGRSWCHLDLPAAIPQYFVSELDAHQFSPSFVDAAARVLGTSVDPLHRDPSAPGRLAALASNCGLALADAQALLPVLVSCFGRQHHDPALADYQTLRAESEEAAWIATEGTVCNHMTDRVDDVEGVAQAERAAGRPISDTVEVSGSGRIRQTAHRSALVTRSFGLPDGGSVQLTVPGSFFEFIARAPMPDGSGVDLAFDAANAQQIFAMTRGGMQPQ